MRVWRIETASQSKGASTCILLLFALPVIRSKQICSESKIRLTVDSRRSQRCTMRCHVHIFAELVVPWTFSSLSVDLDCFVEWDREPTETGFRNMRLGQVPRSVAHVD
jgi:hypothetical protein